jgi:hypothetical protein
MSAIVAGSMLLQFGVARADDPVSVPSDLPVPVSTDSPLPVGTDSPLPVETPTTPGVSAPGLMVQGLTADSNANGFIDDVTVQFAVPMSAGLPSKSDGTSPGIYVRDDATGTSYGISSFSWSTVAGQNAGGVARALDIHLVEGSAPDTAATPTVHYVSGGGGLLAADNATEMSSSKVASIDNAAPVLIAASARDAAPLMIFNGNGDMTKFTFSEPVAVLGATPADRIQHLERSIAFTNVSGGNCSADGTGVPGTGNFPTWDAANPTTASDPIDAPATGAFSDTVVVSEKPGTKNSVSIEYPAACRVGIASAPSNTFIVDASPVHNVAAVTPLPASSRYLPLGPASVAVTGATTTDGNFDGKLDGIRATFDSAIDPASLSGALSLFTVSNGGQNVTPATISAVAGNARAVDLAFDSSWDTGAHPTLAYAPAADCATGGAGLKSGTSDTWTCAGAFSGKAVADGAQPVMLGARTADTGPAAAPNGKIDSIHVTFSEPLTTATMLGWTVAGYTPASFTLASDGRSADIGLTEGSASDTGATPAVGYSQASGTAADAASNKLRDASATASDGAPAIIAGATVTDANANGTIDHVAVTFSEPMTDPAPGAAADFKINRPDTGATTTGLGFAADAAANDATLTLATEQPGTGAMNVIYSPSGAQPLTDAAGNQTAAQSIDAKKVTDAAAPVAVVTTNKGPSFATGDLTVIAKFSEPMTDGPVTATFGSDPVPAKTAPDANNSNAHTTNGWVVTGPNAPLDTWEGAYTVGNGFACTVATGCPVTITVIGAQDAATPSNAQGAPGVLQANVDTVAPHVSAPQFSTLQTAGEPAPANTVNMFSEQLKMTAGMPAGEATGGHAEILVDDKTIASGGPYDSSATQASVTTDFSDQTALQTRVSQGAHSVALKLCDAAQNCATTAAVAVSADYVPVRVKLATPNGGQSYAPGDQVAIQWADLGDGLSGVELAFSADGGNSFSTIATLPPTTLNVSTPDVHQSPVDAGAQPVAANGVPVEAPSFTWKVPNVSTSHGRIRALTIDASGNKSSDASVTDFGVGQPAPSPIPSGTPTADPSALPTGAPSDLPTGVPSVQGIPSGVPTGAPTGLPTGTPTLPSSSPSPGTSPSTSPSPSPSPTEAPEVETTGPAPSSQPFVASDKATTVTWQADDNGSLADDPITIEYSEDGGTNWAEINGGNYSHSNDGAEAWRVPKGSSFQTMIRVTVTAASGNSRSDVAGPFVQGVSGYVVDGRGNVLPYGSADARTRESHTMRNDVMRGIAVRPDRTGGYVVQMDGSVWPFATGSAAMPKAPKYTKLSGDLARGLVLRNATSGYVLDAYGRLYPFGGAPAAHPSKTWVGKKYAAGIEMLPGARGGYVLDVNGHLYPFSVGSYKMPAAIRTPALRGTATGFGLRDAKSGWILATDGTLKPFGGAPARASSGTGSKAGAAHLIVVTSDGGYWVDRAGRLHTWGSAWGNPTRTTSSSRVRGAS